MCAAQIELEKYVNLGQRLLLAAQRPEIGFAMRYIEIIIPPVCNECIRQESL